MRTNARRAVRDRAGRLPHLVRFEGDGLEPRRDYDAIDFVDRDFTGQDASDIAGATLSKVDLSGARLRSLIGVESLRGAIVSQAQLHDLAPLLAAELGLEVLDDGPDDRADPSGSARAARTGS
jgi:uncharacterized protein YjbI with pentapeptide repeats